MPENIGKQILFEIFSIFIPYLFSDPQILTIIYLILDEHMHTYVFSAHSSLTALRVVNKTPMSDPILHYDSSVKRKAKMKKKKKRKDEANNFHRKLKMCVQIIHART